MLPEGLRPDRGRGDDGRFRALLEALPAAVYATDAAGVITFCNEAAATLAGRRPQLGKDRWCVTWRLYWPDGTPLAHRDCPMAVALKENRPVRGVAVLAERPDGTRVALMPSPTPLHDETGALMGGVNILVELSAETCVGLAPAPVRSKSSPALQGEFALMFCESILHALVEQRVLGKDAALDIIEGLGEIADEMDETGHRVAGVHTPATLIRTMAASFAAK